MKSALIVGVGPVKGLGAMLAIRFAALKLHVYVVGRTVNKLKKVVKKIESFGGKATAVDIDATDEESVKNLFSSIKNLDLCIYNAGNATPGMIEDIDSDYFYNSWKVLCFGGFLFGKYASRTFKKKKRGKLFFTGASASLRGAINFAAFNSGKGGLRNFAQALAKEYGPYGVHVANIIIDGPINGERIRKRNPSFAKNRGKKGLIDINGIVDCYIFLYNQPSNAQSFELDVRTSIEKW